MSVNRSTAAWILWIAIAALTGAPSAQQSSTPPAAAGAEAETLRRGRALLQRLTLAPDADAAIFAALPAGEPEALLTSVLSHAQGYQSDPAHWPEMHRALSALVELSLFRKQEFKAAVYESFQATLYQNYDQDDEQALSAYQRALVLGEKYAPAALQASYISNVGQALYRLGRTDEALPFLRRAREAAVTPFDLSNANNWRAIVLAELTRKHLADATAEADAFVAASGDANATAVFRAYAHLAASDVQIEKGDYDGMIRSVQQAIAAAGSDPQAEIVGYACVPQLLEGVIAASTSLPYDEALALAKRIAREIPSLPVPLEAFAEATIRRRRRAAGDLDAMLRADNARLAEARKTGDAAAIAEALLGESLDYAWMNAARQSIGLLDEASTLLADELSRATYPGGEGLALLRIRVLTNLGLAYGEAGELERARSTWDDIVRVIEAVPSGIARQQLEPGRTQALVGNARVAELEEDPERAAELLQKALPLVQGKSGPTRSEVLNDLARVTALSGADPAGVATTYEQAVGAAGDERDRDLQTSIRLAFAKFLSVGPGRGLPDAATRAARELGIAQEDARRLQLASAVWKVEYGLGLLEEQAGRADAAIARFTQAAGLVETMRASLTLDENRQSFVDNKGVQELYDHLLGLLMRTGRRQQAWEYLQRDKARSFSEMLRGRTFAQAGPPGSSGPLAEMERRIIRMKLELSPDNAPLVRASGRQPAAIAADLRRVISEYELALQARQLGTGSARRADALASRADVQNHLPPATALVEYALLPDAVAVFVTTRTRADAVLTPADGRRLRRDLLKLRRALSSPASAPEAEELIATVSAPLVSPVEPHLHGITHVAVVAAGAMNYVPFQVLRTADGRQVVDRFTVSNLPSASTVPLLHATRVSDRSLFVGALGRSTVPGWPPLPGTLREAREIARIFPRARLVVEDQFTASRVIAALQRDSVVHLATHGDVDDQAPLFSAVITTPSRGEASRLSLYELMNVRVKSDLVVLSACQTAAGKLLGGDEITSLTRTLLLAGSNAVVSSLWNIDDAVTADLMRVFYAELRRGRPPADALRTAELAIRKQHPEPAYWAPFVATSVR